MIQLKLESSAPTRPVTSKFKLSLGVCGMPKIFRSSVYENAPLPSLVPVPVEKVLCDSKIDKSNVHEIILVSGSTCILVLFKLVSHFSISKEPKMSINPDESVVYGAAVQAAILSADTSEMIFSSTFPQYRYWDWWRGHAWHYVPIKNPKFPLLTLTVNPVCLYKYTKASVLAPRTTTCSASLSCLASLLHLVASLKLKLFLIFKANGILNVSASDKTTRTGKSNRVIITNDKDHFIKDINCTVEI